MTHELRVCLTGGIASGKSTAGEMFADRGGVVIDSDVLAREVVAPGTPGLAAVIDRFGSDVLTADGALDRPALGKLVFGDEEARRDLNAIIHPLVIAESKRRQQEAWDQGRIPIRMIPLLVETGQAADFDEVIVVDVDPRVQLRRLMARNPFDEQEAWARINAQASREERLAVATQVIDNSGTVEDLAPQVDRVWRDLGRSTTQP